MFKYDDKTVFEPTTLRKMANAYRDACHQIERQTSQAMSPLDRADVGRRIVSRASKGERNERRLSLYGSNGGSGT